VVLKRLAEAVADGDSIYAVIKGIAINNDGSSKVGFNPASMVRRKRSSWHSHWQRSCTGDGLLRRRSRNDTLGDPIEVAALSQAFRASTDTKGFCALGSVKSNIGHLDAAGMAGLIKTALALSTSSCHPVSEKPNPKFDIENTPFMSIPN